MKNTNKYGIFKPKKEYFWVGIYLNLGLFVWFQYQLNSGTFYEKNFNMPHIFL